MRIAFTALAVIGVAYFLGARRRFDLFSLAFLSSCVYFLPGFFGTTLTPTRDFAPPASTPLEPGTYAVFFYVLAAVLGSGVLFARVAPMRAAVRVRLPAVEDVAAVSVGLGYLGLFALLTHGRELLNPDKFTLLQSLDRWHLVLTTFATVGAVTAAARKHLGILASSLPLFGIDLFLGSRTTTALAAMAIILVWLAPMAPSRILLRQRRLVVVALAMAVLFFAWQQLFLPFKRGDWAELFKRGLSPATYRTAFLNSEPFTTQAILNEVVRTQYRVPPDHLLDVAAAAVPFYSKFFESPRSFNDYFQPDLFPGIRLSGLANNFWAEALAVGGWVMLAGYVVFYVVTLAAGSFGLRSQSLHMRAVSAMAGAYIAFFVHRNDLLFELLLVRRLLGGYFVSVILAFLLIQVRRPRTLAASAAP